MHCSWTTLVLVTLLLAAAPGLAKVCSQRRLVSRPARVSYKQIVRRTVTYPCCTNLLCDPPVCTRVRRIITTYLTIYDHS